MRSIQCYDGSGETSEAQVRRLAAITHKKPIYIIDRKDDGGHGFLTITVRTANLMNEPLFTMRWQGGSGNTTDRTMDHWYAGKVELETKDGEDLVYRTRYLNRLFKLIKSIHYSEPKTVIAALETIGVIEGDLDEVLDSYRPLEHHIPAGYARYYEETAGNSSWDSLDVIAHSEDDARGLLEARLGAQTYYAERLARWIANGRRLRQHRRVAKPAISGKPKLSYLPESTVTSLVDEMTTV